MSGVAVLVFVALYFVKAGYGMFRTSSWGLSLDNKLAWVLMEAPAFVGMLVCWLLSGAGMVAPQSAMVLLFLLRIQDFLLTWFVKFQMGTKPFSDTASSTSMAMKCPVLLSTGENTINRLSIV